MELLIPKKKILSYNYLKGVNKRYKKKIIKNFQYLSDLKINNQNKKNKLKLNFISLLSQLEYTGRTRYTDFIVLVIGLELYLKKIILTDIISIFWLGLAIAKFIIFFKNILKLQD